ncbi:MAG: hypothetical protein ACI8RD_011503, partial [Bacillariaceae sp.]
VLIPTQINSPRKFCSKVKSTLGLQICTIAIVVNE